MPAHLPHERPKRGRGAGQEERRQQTEVRETAADRTAADDIQEGLDDILDDIDRVLEESELQAIDFVQKGGE
jgi:hypothetical protein